MCLDLISGWRVVYNPRQNFGGVMSRREGIGVLLSSWGSWLVFMAFTVSVGETILYVRVCYSSVSWKIVFLLLDG